MLVALILTPALNIDNQCCICRPGLVVQIKHKAKIESVATIA